MNINLFFEKLFGQSIEESTSDLKEFVNKYLTLKSDTMWEKGAQDLFVGGVLLLLEQKTKPTIEALQHLFAFDEITDTRRDIIVKNFKKASKSTISYVSSYLSTPEGTFSCYVSILQTFLNRL